MPYKTFPVKGGFKNWKVDEMGKKVGKALSNDPLSEEDADAQREALYAAEEKEADESDDHTKMYGEVMKWLPPGITSFADLDAYMESQDLAEDLSNGVNHFSTIASNIMMSDLVEDKAAALTDLANEFATRLQSPPDEMKGADCEDCDNRDDALKAVWSTAFVNNLPDSSFLYVEKGSKCGKDGEGKTKPRSCRHFPYKDASGKVDLPHLRNAIARIPQSNAPGLNKASVQERARRQLQNAQKEADEESLVNRIVDKVKAIFGKEEPVVPDDMTYIWKEADGRYHCLLAYSNNFRDNDNPPEIISAQSHKEFDDALNKSEWPMPKLWLWHVPYPVGNVITHAYDEKSGFSLAGAVFDEDKGWAAEAIMSRPWDALSHGMPRKEIRRDSNDKSIITRHRTREISFLPRWAAANKNSFYLISKEIDEMDKNKEIPAHKLEEFTETFGEEQVKKIQEAMAGTSQQAKEDGTESKEATTPTEPEQETAEGATAATTTPGDVVEAIQALTTVLSQQGQMLKSFDDRLKELEKTDKERIENAVKAVPEASLADMVKSQLFTRQNEVKDKGPGPKEAENKEQDGSNGLFFANWSRADGLGVPR